MRVLLLLLCTNAFAEFNPKLLNQNARELAKATTKEDVCRLLKFFEGVGEAGRSAANLVVPWLKHESYVVTRQAALTLVAMCPDVRRLSVANRKIVLSVLGAGDAPTRIDSAIYLWKATGKSSKTLNVFKEVLVMPYSGKAKAYALSRMRVLGKMEVAKEEAFLREVELGDGKNSARRDTLLIWCNEL